MKQTWNLMERWMKLEMLLMVIFTISGAIMGNVVVKMQGVLFSLATISVLMILVKSGGLLLPIIKNIDTGQKYFYLMLMGYIEILVLGSYGYVSDDVWLSVYILLGVPYSLILSAFFIDYDVIVKDITSTKMFTEIMYIERIMFSAIGIVGGGLTYILSLWLSIHEIIIIVTIIKLASSFLILYQYRTTYRGLTIAKDEMSKNGKSSIFLKKSLSEYRNQE